jgi:hypothetical protein
LALIVFHEAHPDPPAVLLTQTPATAFPPAHRTVPDTFQLTVVAAADTEPSGSEGAASCRFGVTLSPLASRFTSVRRPGSGGWVDGDVPGAIVVVVGGTPVVVVVGATEVVVGAVLVVVGAGWVLGEVSPDDCAATGPAKLTSKVVTAIAAAARARD